MKRYFLFILAMFLFCNPMYAGYDVLPDFVGLLLLFLFLIPYVDLHRDFAETQKRCAKFAVLYVAKDALLLLFSYLSEQLTETTNAFEMPFLRLTVVFATALFDFLFLLPLLHETLMVSAIVSLPYTESEKTTIAGRISRFSLPLFILKTVCSVLPECVALVAFGETEGDSDTELLSNQNGVRVLFFLVGMVLGIALFIGIFRKMRDLFSDWSERFEKEYAEEKKIHPEWRERRKNAFVLFLAKCIPVFLLPITLDQKELFPLWLFALLSVLLFLVISGKKSIAGLLLSCSLLMISVLKTVLWSQYWKRYSDLASVSYLESAYTLYRRITVVSVLESLLLGVLLLFVTEALFSYRLKTRKRNFSLSPKKYRIKMIVSAVLISASRMVADLTERSVSFIRLVPIALTVLFFFVFYGETDEMKDDLSEDVAND